MSNNKALRLYEDSAIGAVELETITQVVEVLKATLPDGAKMTREQLGAVAFDAVLTGTMPGRDVHYFESKGRLLKSDDFKLLIRWGNEKEQLMSGDPAATFKDNYRNLTDKERDIEKIGKGDTAVFCTIISDRDMISVKGWKDAGATFQEAIDLVGTTAIGVVKAGDTKIPTGWSAGQKARKLAQKAAIRARYGQPSMDELAAMRRRWAKVAGPEDWQEVPADLPLEAQARLADLTVISREAQEKAAERTPEERKKALEKRTNILRGKVEEVGIGDDEPEPSRRGYHVYVGDEPEEKTREEIIREEISETMKQILQEIPWFDDEWAVEEAMNEEVIGFFDPDLISKLRVYASNQMDAQTEVEIKQDDFHDM